MINFNFSCDQRHLHCFNSIDLPLLFPFSSFIPSFHSPLPFSLLFSSLLLRRSASSSAQTSGRTPRLQLSVPPHQSSLHSPLLFQPPPPHFLSLCPFCLVSVSTEYLSHILILSLAQNIYAGCLPAVALASPFALRPFVRRARFTPVVHPAALNLSLLDLAGIIVCR